MAYGYKNLSRVIDARPKVLSKAKQAILPLKNTYAHLGGKKSSRGCAFLATVQQNGRGLR